MIIQLVDLLQSMSFSRLLSIYLCFLVPPCFFLRMLRAEALFQHRWDDFDEVPELVVGKFIGRPQFLYRTMYSYHCGNPWVSCRCSLKPILVCMTFRALFTGLHRIRVLLRCGLAIDLFGDRPAAAWQLMFGEYLCSNKLLKCHHH